MLNLSRNEDGQETTGGDNKESLPKKSDMDQTSIYSEYWRVLGVAGISDQLAIIPPLELA